MTAPTLRLLVCVGPNCDAQGRGRALLAAVQDALASSFREELATGQLAVTTRDCLRHCTREPVVRFEPSGDAFSNPALDDLLLLVRESLRA